MTFSYTDDAIVSASPTGRHLSTVIKRPAVLMSGWNEHAEQICKAMNALLPSDKISGPSIADLIKQGCLNPLSTDFPKPRKAYSGVKPLDLSNLEQRVSRSGPLPYAVELCMGGLARVANQLERAALERKLQVLEAELADIVKTLEHRELQVTNLRGQLDDTTTKLCAAQMLLEQPVVVPLATDTLQVMYHAATGTVSPAKTGDGRKVELKRV